MEPMSSYERLLSILKGYGSVAVAFSGGVDSTLLLKAAKEALGPKAIAVTAGSRLVPERESAAAADFCEREGIGHIAFEFDELGVDGFADNPADRCYICKKALFLRIRGIAGGKGIGCVAEGSNLDDDGDYRPGMKALAELGIKSPLKEAGFFKADVRAAARSLGLQAWDKPSFACLATRFPYGERIGSERLLMVDRAERLLLGIGFTQVRVRIHGESAPQARIEILPEEFPRIMEEKTRLYICSAFLGLGFKYVSLDLAGYRTGSMNEAL